MGLVSPTLAAAAISECTSAPVGMAPHALSHRRPQPRGAAHVQRCARPVPSTALSDTTSVAALRLAPFPNNSGWVSQRVGPWGRYVGHTSVEWLDACVSTGLSSGSGRRAALRGRRGLQRVAVHPASGHTRLPETASAVPGATALQPRQGWHWSDPASPFRLGQVRWCQATRGYLQRARG